MLKFKIFNLATARSRNEVSFGLSAFFPFECFSFELYHVCASWMAGQNIEREREKSKGKIDKEKLFIQYVNPSKGII